MVSKKYYVRSCRSPYLAPQIYQFYSRFNLEKNRYFLPFNQAFFQSCLISESAICLLLWRQNSLYGYSIAFKLTEKEPLLLKASQAVIEAIKDQFCVHQCMLLSGTLLDYSVRQQGWHKIMLEYRINFAIDKGAFYLFTTVSPFNTRSLSNLIRAGFVFYRAVFIHQVYRRFIMYRLVGGCLSNRN